MLRADQWPLPAAVAGTLALRLTEIPPLPNFATVSYSYCVIKYGNLI